MTNEKLMMINSVKVLCFLILPVFTGFTLAAVPALKTPSPVIFLSDNLDEPDNLGWCIDTLGRGYAENLQAHSCKPQGGDVQFGYDSVSKTIYSVAFEGKCMSQNPEGKDIVFGLVDCDTSSPNLQFDYNQTTGYIMPVNDSELCVAVGADYRSAGPFSSRDLLFLPCAETDPIRIQWTFKQE